MPKQRIPLLAVRRQWLQRIRSVSTGSISAAVSVERHGDDSDALWSDIENLIQERPQIAVKIIRTLASRLERTTQKLADQFKEPPVWSVEPPED